MRILELGPGESARAFAAMRALRPALPDVETFARRVDERLRPQGYRLACVESDDGEVVAVAGFRVPETLAWGRVLYLDDLSTLPAGRRRGHGRALLDWLLEEALRLGCDELHLDSGVGPDRADAHRLYLNAGLRISSHHFSRGL